MMNSRFASLPFPSGNLIKGRWEPSVQTGYSSIGAGFMKLNGTLFGAAVDYGFHPGWAVQLFGFYDHGEFSGGSGQKLMNPLFLTSPPVDLPAKAEFLKPHGEIRHNV